MLGYSTVTQKGQITVPADIREELGLLPRQKVVIIMQGDSVFIKPVANFYTLRGSVKSKRRPADYKRMRKNFIEHLTKRKVYEKISR
ncbi:AbrB/MazE/SpoVT family DNA-binding domain-containing protein [Candidatus Roizmanbacteria bacterium]|nr:AbrB/MazE/SpoVT family DNA-binding domain-containing protein [Candidatus Roizmanbacteria bacterium]